MDLVQLAANVVPNLLFAAIYVTFTSRWIDKGLTFLQEDRRFLHELLQNCLEQRSQVKGERSESEASA